MTRGRQAILGWRGAGQRAATSFAPACLLLTGPLDGHPRGAVPRDVVSVRPADPSGAANDAAAAGPAHAHADPRLLAAHRAAPGTSSTGSRTRRPTFWPDRLSRRRCESFRVVVDLVAEMTVINPFDFFLEPEAEKYPVRVRRVAGARIAPVSGATARRARACEAWLDSGRSHANMRTIDFLVGLNQRLNQRDQVPDSPGAGRADAGGNARRRARGSCRDYGLAAGADAAASGPGRAVCLRLSDSAQARREVARWSRRRGAGLHRPARLVRSLSARRRLGRTRSDQRPVRRRRAHSAGRHARSVVGRAGHRRARSVRSASSST